MIKGFEKYKKEFNVTTAGGIQLRLHGMEDVLKALGDPHKQLKVIHIAGTNGKGSTLSFLNSILLEAGYKTGRFTSPCIEDVRDQITSDNLPISADDFRNILKEMIERAGKELIESLTDFELLTVMALYYFSKIKPHDYVLIETGMGGKDDSTNIVEPILTMITNIGIDHVNFLGHDINTIARHKAGIIKKNIPIIATVDQEEALAVIRDVANEQAAPLYIGNRDFKIDNVRHLETGEQFSLVFQNNQLEDLEIQLIGSHQVKNASLAVAAACLLNMDENSIRQGLRNAFWPNRFEIVSRNPFVVIDGAHNEEGIDALTNVLANRYNDRKKTIVFAALGDKNFTKMIEKLDEAAEKIIFVEFDFPRAAKAEEFYSVSRSQNKFFSSDWQEIIKKELDEQNDGEMLIITGSLYFLANVKPFLTEKLSL